MSAFYPFYSSIIINFLSRNCPKSCINSFAQCAGCTAAGFAVRNFIYLLEYLIYLLEYRIYLLKKWYNLSIAGILSSEPLLPRAELLGPDLNISLLQAVTHTSVSRERGTLRWSP